MNSHCRAGHEYTPANMYIDPKGHLRCRQCKRERRTDRPMTEEQKLRCRALNQELTDLILSKAKEKEDRIKAEKQAKRIKKEARRCDRKKRLSRYYFEKSLRKRYGITFEDYIRLLDEQNSSCAICGRHESAFNRRLAVDHDHTKTGLVSVRGLLCSGCNNAIGILGDNAKGLAKALEYLLAYESGYNAI